MVAWLTIRSAKITPWKTPVLILKEAEWNSGGRKRKNERKKEKIKKERMNEIHSIGGKVPNYKTRSNKFFSVYFKAFIMP